jgi:transcriptional regulator with GAF, ATPase, and Fis domain
LRFLQNGEYRPLGSSRSATADVRIIAASNCDLNDKIERKHFRRDLFYRLNVLSITLPPLRERERGCALSGGTLSRRVWKSERSSAAAFVGSRAAKVVELLMARQCSGASNRHPTRGSFESIRDAATQRISSFPKESQKKFYEMSH